MRAQPTFQTSWRDEATTIHYYDIPIREQVQAHVLMLPILLGLQPSRHIGVYVGPTVGVGAGHYKTDFCGEGWKHSVPYGAQADVVLRAEALGRLEAGVSVGFLMHNPIVTCADSPERLARIQNDEMLFSVGATAAYRFW